MQFRQSSSAHHSTVSEGLEHHREEANSPGDDSDTITNCIKVFRSKCGSVVTNQLFQSFITTLIVANAILLGIGTFDFVTDNPDNEHAFFKADQAFLIIFTVEILLQFIYLDVALFRDPWLVFDLIIIIVSWVYEGLTVLRALRTLRLVIRIKNVRNLVVSILSALPQLGAIIFLLLLIMYIFAVVSERGWGKCMKGYYISLTLKSMNNISLMEIFRPLTCLSRCSRYFSRTWNCQTNTFPD